MATLLSANNIKRCNFFKIHCFSSFSKQLEYRKCCKILGVSEDSDQEAIRAAYLKLVKIYHPDSGTKQANAEKFSEIDKAFKTLITRKSQERWQIDDSANVQEQDIKQHMAPQHRQYLSHDGWGYGNPFQREKQYKKIRAFQAAENVMQHRISKVAAEDGALLDKSAPTKHKIKTTYGFDRLVEDLIQESMSKGEFSNLKGSGKPLKHQNRNPYVDFVTHKLNEVLIDNGFTPEWITLQREIREEINSLRKDLYLERTYFGPYPLKEEETHKWFDVINNYKKPVENINKKINKFNLVVPILDKQMLYFNLEKESAKVLVEGKNCSDPEVISIARKKKQNCDTNVEKEEETVIGLLSNLFKM